MTSGIMAFFYITLQPLHTCRKSHLMNTTSRFPASDLSLVDALVGSSGWIPAHGISEGVYFDRRTPCVFTSRSGAHYYALKIGSSDQDGRFCPRWCCFHLSDHSVRFME